jgi:tetratricopeptide (TPR) repeat protein
MRSCIGVLYIALFCIPPLASAQTDPDALYRNRANLASARDAAAAWEMRLAANPQDFESAWKLARASYWLGGHGDRGVPADASAKAARAALERGVAAGQTAARLQPNRPEGHFWTAANMGALAESYGLRQGIKYRGAIKSELEAVLRIDPSFQDGSADRALGRWYFKVPSLFGGSKAKSEEHLRKSLTYNADSTASHFFLAETLFELKRDHDAVEELNKVIAAPLDPEWLPEDREFKEQAERRLRAVSR